MQCTICKSEILATAKFCPECGNKVENTGKTCPNKECNRTGLPPEAVFCPDCGTALPQNSNSETIGSIILGLTNFRNTKTQQHNSPIRENSMYSYDILFPYSISEECVACGCCIDECPVEAISEGNIYRIDADLCTECGSCAEVCPVDAISQLNS